MVDNKMLYGTMAFVLVTFLLLASAFAQGGGGGDSGGPQNQQSAEGFAHISERSAPGSGHPGQSPGGSSRGARGE